MTILKHELKQSRRSLLIWTGSIGFFILICVFLYPEMKQEMAGISSLFASMGAFTAAFGMDRLDFGTLTGFYAIECGNILGISGALFASLIGVNILSKEEKEGTAEFLLSHPISRFRLVTEKLLALLAQLVILNAAVFLLSALSLIMIGEEVPWQEISLLHFAFFLVQIELCALCFCISAFLRQGGPGAGMGLAIFMYFLNIIANISKNADFLKYITPFGYAEGADLISSMALDGSMTAAGMGLGIAGILCGYLKYCRKDIR